MNNEIRDYCAEAIMNANGDELVVESSACPDCGESRMDWLVWLVDSDFVRCATCGLEYEPE